MIEIIAAMDKRRLIGKDGGLPWSAPADLRRFAEYTKGGTLLMGRKTFESIGRPLRGRRNVVVSRNPDWRPKGVSLFGSLEAALSSMEGGEHVYVIGGASLYKSTIPFAARMRLTLVHGEYQGDTYFPRLGGADDEPVGCRRWQVTQSRHYPADANNPPTTDYTLNVGHGRWPDAIRLWSADEEF
jgi:dihydrofolate reductase